MLAENINCDNFTQMKYKELLFFPRSLKLSQWSAITAPPGSSCHSLKAGSKNMGGQRKGGKQNRQGTDNSRKKQKRRGAAIRLGVQIILVL